MVRGRISKPLKTYIFGGIILFASAADSNAQHGIPRGKSYRRPVCPPQIYHPTPESCPPELLFPDQSKSTESMEGQSSDANDGNQNDSQQNQTQNNQPPLTEQQQQANEPSAAQQQISNALANVNVEAFQTTAPNMVGDFLGFTNTSNFNADPVIFARRSASVTGPSLTGLTPTPNGVGGFSVTLPETATSGSLGTRLGRDITLNFDAAGNTDLSSLTSEDRAALASFLGRQASMTIPNTQTGTINLDASSLTATTGGPATDLTLDGTDNFIVGGFSPNELVVLPRAGVAISRFKASEQTSPVPRDRILFNYGAFNNAIAPGPGGASTQDVHRFVPGIERTIFDGDASLEARLPFASTFDSYQPMSAQGELLGASNTELGNLVFSYKQIIAQGENALVSTGLSLELPTADDIEVENDAFLIRRLGESVHLSPFLGTLWTPTDRLFLQAFGQVSFDTNGERVTIQDKYQQVSGNGVLQDATTLFVDLQAGYWMYRNENISRASQISGMAGLLEMHFNQTIQDTDYLTQTVSGVPFTFGDPNGGSIGVANLTAGMTTEFGKKSTMTLAYAVPLTDTDRQFDGEFQVAFNYYFDNRGSQFSVPSASNRR